MVRPKKQLGQHFLTDPGIAQRIADLYQENTDTSLIEIGPGKGILTDFLINKESREFKAIEIDTEAIQFLKSKYNSVNIEIVNADFLKLDSSYFSNPQTAIIGNFPYNISSQIFFKTLQQRSNVRQLVGMIQKEVAERIVAAPGSKVFGILSVLLQAYYNCKLHFHVKPGSFHPPPAVTSSVISLVRNEKSSLDCNEDLFFRVVKATFNQRRKTIRNSLKTILLNLRGHSELLSMRPEQLGVEEFVELTNWVESNM